MEALVVVASEERKSIRVPGWLLERGWVAELYGTSAGRVGVWGLRGGSLLGVQVWVSAGGRGGGERSTVMAVKVAGGREVLERGGGER